ncbi:MAG TPA: hypothetical protein VJH23_05645 [archaeon]|nr:hypothetical protein [archaeon]
MPSTIEYLAIAAVGLVLVISAVQAMQLSGLNEKVAQQNAGLGSFDSVGNTSAVNQANQSSAPAQSALSNQMVGGC